VIPLTEQLYLPWRKTFVFLIAIFILNVSIITLKTSNIANANETPIEIAGFENSLLILPGEEYILKYSSSEQIFSKESESLTAHLSKEIRNILTKVPKWLQISLLDQINRIENPTPYLNLILQSEDRYIDEIAFCIAHAPLGNPPDAELIKNNIQQLYAIDELISYADIIDINANTQDYYSTIQYAILTENDSITRILPKEIYYWYIVHPQILSEKPSLIYGSFWRSYLFRHNDIGYPLLLEKIQNISFLWDQQSYAQPANRNWEESIALHPTAIEAVSYWIGKTVPFQAFGDRPGQPNLIAHQHNGFCGELQRIAVAGLRSVMVPSISVCNIAEDHVWRAFYDQGWHQNDNWWSDTGGTVDIPEVYSDGWGKDMSSVFSWRGDGVVTDVTSQYISSKNTVNVSFSINDMTGHSIDGARVTVLVKGLKDISWYKLQIIEILESLWDILPEHMKGLVFDSLYSRIIQRIENISDVVEGLTISIWNYTNAEGMCSFTLGKNDEYVFLIQQPLDKLPFPFASWTTIRFLKNPVDTDFSIRFPKKIREKKPLYITPFDENNSESIQASVIINSSGFQYQANVRNEELGQYECNCPLSVFILSEEEYIKYVNNEDFSASYYKLNYIINDTFSIEDNNCYILFYNPTQHIITHPKVQIIFKKETNQEQIILLQPDSTLFDHPIFQIGETIHFKGISSSQTQLEINEHIKILPAGFWTYTINTSFWNPDNYIITISSVTKEIKKEICLVDTIPPECSINSPHAYEIVLKGEIITVYGTSYDNHKVETVSIGIDNKSYSICQGTTEWISSIDTTLLTPGIHNLSVKIVDASYNQQIINRPIIINDTTHEHKPNIQSINWNPLHPTNKSNIIIYTNVSMEKAFPIKKIFIEYRTTDTKPLTIRQLYEYAQHPIQNRHIEDPKQNQSNYPCYGIELGSFTSGEQLFFRITAIDVTMNKEISSWQTILID